LAARIVKDPPAREKTDQFSDGVAAAVFANTFVGPDNVNEYGAEPVWPGPPECGIQPVWIRPAAGVNVTVRLVPGA